MTLHVHTEGAGPDLVLLHGWALHSGIWDELAAQLAKHYRVHCIDLPGHGQSAESAQLASLPELARHVSPAIPEGADVVGWSLGGLLALELAAHQALRSLVLISTTPKFLAADDWPHGMRTEVFTQFTTRLQADFRGTVEDFLMLQVRGEAHAADTLRVLRSRLLQHPPQVSALRLGLQLLRDSDVRSALPHIQIPTFVIAGANDRITPPGAGAYLATHLPQARLLELRRAGHAPFISHASEVLTAMQAFLSGAHGDE